MAKRDLERWLWQLGNEPRDPNSDLGVAFSRLAHGHGWTPRVDVYETDQNVLVLVELAGVSESDVRIGIDPEMGRILIRGRRDLLSLHRCQPHQIEIPSGEFERDLPIPPGVYDLGRTDAKLSHGLLIIEFPKSEPEFQIVERRWITLS
ncbi:MAG: Hsp20/alpha crystallin family protein [Armatimonadetes bacterium]|nr:Hsp20/alpha crystallin family protein [Armatimonadota bacterium]